LTIDRAEQVAAGELQVRSLPSSPESTLTVPAFCRVTATLRPSKDSDIKMEIWLPSSWNTKLVSVGNGGWNGMVSYSAMVDPLQRGYAVASTDTGHVGSSMDGSFAYRHPEKLIDFGWRAVHEMTVAAKDIIRKYYEPKLTRTYWNGCSSGGKQGLKEAQQFPEDYDGIIAGAPAVPWTRLSAASLWVGRATLPIGSPRYLSRDSLALLSEATVEHCDLNDKVADGVIDDPRTCTFDPAQLLCSAAGDKACLTESQVAAARAIYAPLRQSKTGDYLYAGFAKGSELGWGLLAGGPKPLGIANDYYRFVVFEDPNWDFMTMDFDRDVAKADQIDRAGGQLNAADPNLDEYRKRGGKLLMYHGWSDALIPSQSSIDYFESVLGRDDSSRSDAALATLQRDVRLFMVPGLGHCSGGSGATQFDALSALEEWVEQGRAPETMTARGKDARGTLITRPLCVYPKVTTFAGAGDPNLAANFRCE
jgi:feruloyl esterase